MDLQTYPIEPNEHHLAIMADIKKLKNSGSDLMVRTHGASIIIPSIRLQCTDNKIGIAGTDVNISLDKYARRAKMIPVNYGIAQEDIDDGSSVVIVNGPDHQLASVSVASAKHMLNAVASVTEEIEAIARTHDMLSLSQDLINKFMHPARELEVTVNGLAIQGLTLLNWADINAVHLNAHIFISYGTGKILTITAVD